MPPLYEAGVLVLLIWRVVLIELPSTKSIKPPILSLCLGLRHTDSIVFKACDQVVGHGTHWREQTARVQVRMGVRPVLTAVGSTAAI